jgi:hypothetical protein
MLQILGIRADLLEQHALRFDVRQVVLALILPARILACTSKSRGDNSKTRPLVVPMVWGRPRTKRNDTVARGFTALSLPKEAEVPTTWRTGILGREETCEILRS